MHLLQDVTGIFIPRGVYRRERTRLLNLELFVEPPIANHWRAALIRLWETRTVESFIR
jgi:hypothetical protein